MQFRYATSLDIVLIFIGMIGGIAHGVLMPMMILVFGDVLNSFTDRTRDICTANFTELSINYCPPGYNLTASNFFSSLE